MSKSTIFETERKSIKIDSNIEERVKKLEDIFDSIEYVSPAPFVYKIIIEDKKIKTLSLNRFNIMSSLHFIFISFNNILPIFRVNIDKSIKIESFNKEIDGNKLIIIIKEEEPLKAFNEKRKNIYLKSFFDIVLKRVYNKYSYYNSKIFYINNLKKKCMNYLKYYYLYSLREKQKENKMKIVYYKKFFTLLKEIHNAKKINNLK